VIKGVVFDSDGTLLSSFEVIVAAYAHVGALHGFAAPNELVMVGDTPVDIMTGKNGGAGLTIGLTHGNSNRRALQAADADYVVDSLAECTAVLLKA
jgi:phosphoglycolate phosphatase-like HAD superfamily hydrolase